MPKVESRGRDLLFVLFALAITRIWNGGLSELTMRPNLAVCGTGNSVNIL